MTHLQSIDSLALFGSLPRGDSDHQSDRDVLVVSDRYADSLESEFANAGFSPSVYSWQQLENLARDGSLFLQHLKQESRVLFDRAGHLYDLLSRFQPKNDYNFRLVENRILFEMTNGVPASTPALSWAFDVLAVAFRNHAILHLAQRKVYIFSYAALVSEIVSEYGLSNSEAALLTDLRTKKHQYRLHPSTAEVTQSTLQRTQALLERIAQVDCLSLRLSPQTFVTRLLDMPHNDVHWYYLLRRYEGAYRAMGFTPTNDATSALAGIERAFVRPSPYGSTGADSIEWIREQVQQLATSRVGHKISATIAAYGRGRTKPNCQLTPV